MSSQPQRTDALTDRGGEVARMPTFDELYRAHFSFVWRALRTLGVLPAQLDDACQEVFVVAHRRFAELGRDSNGKAWLYGIARRVASDHRRSVRRKGSLLPLAEEMPAADHTPDDLVLRRQASDLVLAFLDSLDDDRRAAFVLAELEQMSAPEIAEVCSVNVNTIYSRIGSARKAFVRFLECRRGKSEHDHR